MSMKEFMTDLTYRIVVKDASKIASEAGSNTIGSEHVLLALLESREAGSKFQSANVTVENLAKTIIDLFPPSGKVSGTIRPSEEVLQLLRIAVAKSLEITHKGVITVDVLIYVLISTPECNAYLCLDRLNTDMERFQQEHVEEMMNNLNANGDRVAEESSARASESSARRRPRGGSSSTKTLEQYATNLSELARAGELDPVIGRNKEVERALQVLSRRGKNNPILVGEPGVGKTSIVEGIAQELLTSTIVPESLRSCDVWSLDMTSVIAGTKYRGDFEGRMKKILEDAQGENIILFIDEIHSLNNAGNGEGGLSAANILKPALAKGTMRLIGATTYDEYRKYFEKDAAMARRFQSIDIKEPTIDETILILNGLRQSYEKHHNVIFTDEAISAAAKLSHRYITDRFLPDKAIDLLDESGSRSKLVALRLSPELAELEELLTRTGEKKKQAVLASDFAAAGEMVKQEEGLRNTIREFTSKTNNVPLEITAADIATVLTATTGIPVVAPGDENKRFIRMEKAIEKRVIGQKMAISAISKSVRRQRSGLKDPNRPAGSFIFAGPTGVGKTELAKALAEFMFQDEDSVITLDMSEYSEKHTVSRLFGSPPGYVGHEEGGQLTERVRRKPYSIVLFDEIEKAHPDVFNSLLQILEEGRLTDGQGRVIDFKNTVIIMTTNVGAESLQNAVRGFQLSTNAEANYNDMKSRVNKEMKRVFKPEFLNRFDDIVVFPYLTKNELIQIVDVFVARLNKRLEDHNLSITLTEAAKAHLTTVDYDEKLGARPLRRAIQSGLEDTLSEMMLFGLLENTEHVEVDFVDGSLTFNGRTAIEISISQELLEVSE